ncbi:hypothetical protein W97_01639 [Coniosporium apollinis CBS 100218]|uniref:Translin-associated protein X n=1 Tax=Coniosporium apollinis (strain CBS 100218) TaxID=1168221 RepID=R7YKG3_CONA1|nr:uncharacterized protein W97_01639 [Coniosporium apollinis CBS 100218]EON62417.1 hypothetical protein W97_01639 [Coniosporium apollinis CBS 100218]
MDHSNPPPSSPFIPMFEAFRAELDEHQDRRERVIKASRDITAASKKIIFSLQRVRKLNAPIPESITRSTAPHWQVIRERFSTISADLQSINGWRYARNITGGIQEFMESLSFQYYLEKQQLITFDNAQGMLKELGGEGRPVELTADDYVLGVFDMVGELMRFAITAMATSGGLPGGESRATAAPRNVLSDLRELRTCLEMLDIPPGPPFPRDVDKKMEVMKTCVEKVENGLYGLVVRGRERPKGWMPDLEGRKEEIESF